MTPCPIPGCRTLIIPSQQLVCRWHWKRLPRPVRAELSNLHHNAPESPSNRVAIAAALAYLAECQPAGARA